MSKIKITPLYERLSRDDELQSESNSIVHQEKICQGGISPSETPPINWNLLLLPTQFALTSDALKFPA